MQDDVPPRSHEDRTQEWVGITIFYTQDAEGERIENTRYMDTPIGLIRVPLTRNEEDHVRAVYAARDRDWDVFQLVLKATRRS